MVRAKSKVSKAKSSSLVKSKSKSKKSLLKAKSSSKSMSDVGKSYYVGITNARTLRYNILLSSKEILHVLRSFELVVDIRAKKRKKLTVLKEQHKELILLFNSLYDILPEHKLLAELAELKKLDERMRKKTSKIVKERAVERSEVKVKQPLSELDHLNDALASIENKLKNLV